MGHHYGQVGTVALAITLAGTLLTPAEAQADWGEKPPPGTSYWVDGPGFLYVIKRDGPKIRVGNALSPCYTGIYDSRDGSYRGGGLNQGSGYTRARVIFTFMADWEGMRVKWGHYKRSGWIFQYSRKEALRISDNPRGPQHPNRWFRDCEMR